MKTHLNSPLKARHLLSLVLISSLLLPLPSLALPPVSLATAPLASSTTTTVLPNLMFVLDDSGSMGSNYAPDYVSGAATILFNNNQYNGMYYSPAIRYTPPAFFDAGGLNTTAYPSQTGVSAATGAGAGATPNWHAVKDDAFGVITTSTSDLVDNASFYTFVAGEYCTAPDLKSCITASAPSASNPFPGALRWCNSSALTTCKAVRTLTGTYTFGRYPVQSQATISVTAGSGNLPITGITVSGQQIMSGATAGSNTPSTIASNIANAINNCTLALSGSCTTVGYSASSSGGTVTILAPAATTATLVMAVTPSTQSRTSFTITGASSTPQVTGIITGSKQIMSAPIAGTSNSTSTIAGQIVSAINACTAATTGSCTVSGYSASLSGSTVTIIAPTLTSATLTMSVSSGTLTPSTISAFVPDAITRSIAAFAPGNAIPGTELFTTITSSVTGYPFPGTATKASERTDCTGASCTYAEEMTNYANWWTYYQTRIQSMKTAAGLAFKPIDTRYRVGYNTISYSGVTNGTKFLEINIFDTTQKASWYAKFFAADVGSSTPLRSALSKVGRIFAHKIAGAADPMQYSCQQNFMLMTTDGYWNLGSETSSYAPFDLSGSTWVGNMDSAATLRSAGMYEGPTASSASLADLARYYYITDLRTSTLGNCTGAMGVDVCTNNVFVSGTDNNTRQHMTTFTLGLGVDGVLQYQPDYLTATSGDFYNLKNGLGSPTVNWPWPDTANTGSTVESRVDDLWHAAVNGQGQYFSAKDPSQLTAGLAKALQSIGSKVGAGAAAATSTLNPVAGDNSAYVASYTTVQWSGNLESRSINTVTGAVSQDATWCAEDVIAGTCAAPGSIVQTISGSSTTYTCDTGGATAATCAAPGVLVGTTCKVEVPTSCTGTMAIKIGTDGISDTRTIYTKVGTGLGAFTYANLTGAEQTNFNSAFLAANLSQWSSLTPVQQTAAAGTNLVNFLRGQSGFEMRASNLPINQLYRSRSTVMADPLESKPAFIGKPTFSYLDPGYSAFKTANAGRAGTVFIGTNDGMLHAFDSAAGNERWAYVPSMVIPNMWKLADNNYANMHTNYVNGDSIISDVCSANCGNAASAIWKTVLVAGLNGGGKGYFALDITVPNTPVLLWEFDTSNDDDLGYTFGNPVITKKADGTWVVLFTSGYNNTTGTNPGRGFLYVVDAMTGSVISKIDTGAGNAAAPSGLAKITAFAPDTEHDNTATFTYGGDLSGNVWRFDINAGTSPLLFATLLDSSGSRQPVTTRPELGLINSKRVVFVGTGKYLETSDLTNTQQQTLYAMKDDDATTTLTNARAPANLLVPQTITSTTSATRKINSPQAVNWATGNGWFVDFPDGATASPASPAERQNVNSQLVAGTLLVPTTVPSNTVCSPGGYGWLNFFDYKTGGPVTTSGTGANVVSARTNAPIVGINVLFVPDTSAGAPPGSEKPVVSVVTADQPTPQLIPGVPFNLISSSFQQKRVIWRELTQ